MLSPLTLEYVAASLLDEELATVAEIEQLHLRPLLLCPRSQYPHELPRIIQTWGFVPATVTAPFSRRSNKDLHAEETFNTRVETCSWHFFIKRA